MGSLSITTRGAWQTWTVPEGVRSVLVDMYGAKGGDGVGTGLSAANGTGGQGASTACRLTVTPGDTLYFAIGEMGANGAGSSGSNFSGGLGGQGYDTGVYPTATYYGGTGGGASWIRLNSSTGTVLAVAAGGGGGGVAGYPGVVEAGGNGGSGGTTSTSAAVGGQSGFDNSTDATAGTGAGAAAVGTGGTTGNGTVSNGQLPTVASAYGAGGKGRDDATMFWGLGGGGGGGYYGGGAGGASPAGYAGCGGGGGSCYVNATYGTTIQHTRGVNAGHGAVNLSWTVEGDVQSFDFGVANGGTHTSSTLNVSATIYDPDVGETKWARFYLQKWNGTTWVDWTPQFLWDGTTSTSTSPFTSEATITGLTDGLYVIGVYAYDNVVGYGEGPVGGYQFTVALSSGTSHTQTRGPDALGLSDSRTYVSVIQRSGGSRTEGAPLGDENGRVLTDENGDWLTDGETYTRDDLRNTDSISVLLSRNVTITDALGITDTRSDIDTIARSRTDGLGLLDGVTYSHVTSIIEVTVKRVLVGT